MNAEVLVALAAIAVVVLVFALVATDKDVRSACDDDCNQGRNCDCCESGLRDEDLR